MRTIEKQIINFLSDSANCGKSKENNIKFSFQGWQTSTAKGRINALLLAFSSCSAGIYQKNYQLVFSSSVGVFPIDSDKIYTVKNGKPEEVESIWWKSSPSWKQEGQSIT